jgi:hypothetical protein
MDDLARGATDLLTAMHRAGAAFRTFGYTQFLAHQVDDPLPTRGGGADQRFLRELPDVSAFPAAGARTGSGRRVR